MKKRFALSLFSGLVFALAACSGSPAGSAADVSVAQAVTSSEVGSDSTDAALAGSDGDVAQISVAYDDDDLGIGFGDAGVSYVSLEGDAITIEGEGATAEGSILTITAAGAYSLSGALNDGQIVVDSQAEGTVVLILNGVDIASSTSAPITILNAEKAVITLADGTNNHVSDAAAYVLEDATSDEPNAAVFSKDDLTINGTGSLTVDANYNNGIASKDGLRITGGVITVNAANDGIKGRDYIAVKDGVITINAGGDGMQSNNDEAADEGFVVIEGGTLDITAGMDGVQAETSLTVSGGDISITTGGGSVNSSSDGGNWGNWGIENSADDSGSGDSAKGLKAGVDITIDDGTIRIDASDDAIHSNGSLTINGGDFTLASGDDGIHSDATLVIDGGDVDITKSYEGIESAELTINGGTIHIVASDDGINGAGGKDGSSVDGRPGQNMFEMSGDYSLHVSGGYIAVDAGGDGIDVNGTIDMTGGTVIVHGPTSNNNGALDYLGSFEISGGLLVAAGSAGMAEAPSQSSTQYSVIVTFPSVLPAETLVHIETDAGEEILTFLPTKEYQSVVLSSPDLVNGTTYVAYTGGSSTGTNTDGLYAGGTYTVGTQDVSFTISGAVTAAGSSAGGLPGGPGGRTGGPGGAPPALP